MKDLTNIAENKVMIVGKLLDASFASGKTKTGAPYERVRMMLRVSQTFGGREETSDIPVSMFASQFKKDGSTNPGFENIQNLKKMKTSQNYGYENADTIRIGNGSIEENAYVAQGRLVDGWQLRTSFIGFGKGPQAATFSVEMFIMKMIEEIDREGETTGRLIIKGAIPQWGGRLDVIDFIVENPESVDYISRNWEEGNTVHAVGRIRFTTKEESTSAETGSWGEDIPRTSTRSIHELIITKGSDEGYEEDEAYDPVEIRKGYNARKADRDQKLLEAKEPKTVVKKASLASFDDEDF